MGRSTAFVVVVALLMAACSSGPSTEPAVEPGATPASTTPTEPTSNVVVSDAVPTRQELLDMGISGPAAECFIETIDPNGTGRVTNVDLFVEAFGSCL